MTANNVVYLTMYMGDKLPGLPESPALQGEVIHILVIKGLMEK